MWRFSTVKLLVALILLIIMTPFFEEFAQGDLIEALMITLVLVAAVLAIGGKRSVLIAAALLLVPAIVGKWLSYAYPQTFHPYFFFGFGIAFMGLVVFKLLSYVLRSIQIDTEVLCAAISVYLLLGLIWALAYAFLAQLSPDSFAFAANPHSSGRMDRFNAFYFSFVTLSTVGFGDVTPVSKLARTLAVMEAVTGTLRRHSHRPACGDVCARFAIRLHRTNRRDHDVRPIQKLRRIRHAARRRHNFINRVWH